MGQCWPLQMPPSAKAVLMSLADQANDSGVCWPAIGTICKRTCLSERTVQSSIAWLCQSGVLLVNRTPGRSTNYQINPAGFGAGTVGLFDAPARGDDGRGTKRTGPEQPSGDTHYVYRIEDTATSEFYIGLRTCWGSPERDGYMGSGAWFRQRVSAGSALRKLILSRHATREDAAEAERAAILEARADDLCRNQRTPAAAAPRNNRTPQPLPPAADAEGGAAAAPTPANAAPRTINNRQRTANKAFDAAAIELPDWLDRGLWLRWVKDRKDRKKAITEEGAALQLKHLGEYRADGHSPMTIIERAIAGGYQGLFPPTTKPGQVSTVDANAAAARAHEETQRLLREKAEHAAEVERQRQERLARKAKETA